MRSSRHRPSPRRWIELSFRLPENMQEILIASVAPLGVTGFLQEEDRLTATIPERAFTRTLRTRLDTLLSTLQARFPDADWSRTTRSIAEQNWNERWERTAGIIEATRRIIIKPRWKKLRAADRGKVVIHVDPKMSFGTGHHETTRLSLVLLEEHITPGSRVLDMGCGTAVLSIAAVKLGARSALAVDNDDWALANARENVKKNRVPAVRVRRSLPQGRPGSVDLILSNIDLPTNLNLLPTFSRLLASDGTLILSGLLSRDLPVLLDALQGAGLAPVECLEENEWVAVALRNTHAH